VSKISEYFSTDWSAMTGQDWAGLIITIVVFFGMLIAFARVLNPKRREELEKEKYRILKDDD
jgi:cbb3-type cytochrome oxidase subunit 3